MSEENASISGAEKPKIGTNSEVRAFRLESTGLFFICHRKNIGRGFPPRMHLTGHIRIYPLLTDSIGQLISIVGVK